MDLVAQHVGDLPRPVRAADRLDCDTGFGHADTLRVHRRGMTAPRNSADQRFGALRHSSAPGCQRKPVAEAPLRRNGTGGPGNNRGEENQPLTACPS
ncbi:hypothetical protein MNVM_37230 [Mycobacterium novum]|uniref:Uncharacterized protein n=1 Tax=Mycobacterium novum TaxID=2492438 RepID=A0A7I7JU80_9MYCO|nr:hypothetical protein MNVM_37230 [Mycobacterium novum]